MTRGTVCSNVCTYGSVGALGGQPPRATRPRGTLWVVGVFSILGVLLAWRAYRRWLVADID